jgi:HK97 family phage prohead protease
MTKKSLSQVEIKSADRGTVEAVFSTFDVVDKDGDVTRPGAFTDGEEVLISSYQHTSWGGALPVGKGKIRQTKSEAILEGQFFLDTTAGRDHFTVVKALAGRQQEWSYGFDVLDSEDGTFDGREVRFLKRLKVHEVSPVLVGAGVNTRTLAVKALTDQGYEPREAQRLAERTVAVSEYRAAIRPHESPVVRKAWDIADLELGDSIPDLRSVHAWCDPNGDPEQKSSYAFPHHHGPLAEANLRACLIGIAVLNGAKGAAVPDEDRRGVYNHLAAHLQDGDIDPPELRDSGDTGSLKFYEELDAVLAGVYSANNRAADVMALRATKGKTLAAGSILRLEMLEDELRKLRSRIDSPQDDAARELARFLRSLQNNQES